MPRMRLHASFDRPSIHNLLLRGVGTDFALGELAEEIGDVVEDGDRKSTGALNVEVLASSWVRPRRNKHLGPGEALGQALRAATVLL